MNDLRDAVMSVEVFVVGHVGTSSNNMFDCLPGHPASFAAIHYIALQNVLVVVSRSYHFIARIKPSVPRCRSLHLYLTSI